MKTNTHFLILVIGFLLLSIKSEAQQPYRTISADFNNIKGPINRMYSECIGAGRANEGLRADWQEQLKYVKEQCGFRYIRMHGLLTDDMGVYFEDKNGKSIYNWQYVDKLFDFLLSINIKPFVELGFMPNALASGNKTLFWWRGNITLPKDNEKWAAFMRALVAHFKERYGHEEVKTWYFEVWNEPNLKDGFFAGTQDDYFKLYEITAKAIKDVSTEYRVGGPATAGCAWVPEFIDYCVKNKVPVDFVSTHTYGVKQGYLDENGTSGTVLSDNPQSIYSEIINSRKQIDQSQKPGLELHYTEWSASYTPADPIHDSYHSASYILDKIKNVGNAPNSMSYWVFTDIFEESGIRHTPFHGGFGLLNYQAIRKPAFFAYQYLNQLGDDELVCSDNASWVCKDKKGNIQTLLWDFTITHPGDSVNNQVFYKRDLPSKKRGTIKVALKNIPEGKYQLNLYQTGYRVNDAYMAYYDLGSPAQLSRTQEEIIKIKSNGQPVETSIITISNNKLFEKELSMRENDVYLIQLRKL